MIVFFQFSNFSFYVLGLFAPKIIREMFMAIFNDLRVVRSV